MPFLNDRGKKVSTPYWTVPATGGYMGGYQTGEAMAIVFLKHLRAEEAGQATSWMTGVVESFMIRFEQEGGNAALEHTMLKDWSSEFESLRAQYFGFFGTLAKWLQTFVKAYGANLDHLDDQNLVDLANSGLMFDLETVKARLKAEGKA